MNNNKIEYIDGITKNGENFKLIGFEVEAIFNDYERFQDVYLITDISEVHSLTMKVLLNKENCDETYSIDYTPIYEIINKNYFCFHNLTYFQEELKDGGMDLFVNKKILNADSIQIEIKTPKENIPTNMVLLNKINEEIPNILDINGRTNLEKVNKIIKLLEQF